MSRKSGEGLYDLYFTVGSDTVGVLLDRQPTGSKGRQPAVIDGTYAPSVSGQASDDSDEEVEWSDVTGGMGFSRAGVRRTYSHAKWMWCRNGIVMPSGKLTEITLPNLPRSSGVNGVRAVRASEWYGGDLFLAAGDYVLKMTAGAGTPSVAVWGGELFDARGLASFYDGIAYSLFAGGWGSSAVSPVSTGMMRVYPTPAKSVDANRVYLTTVYWVIDGAGAHRLIGSNAPSCFQHIASGNNPLVDGNWSGITYVGPTRTFGGQTAPEIVGLVTSGTHVYFIRPDGVFDVDTLGFSPDLSARMFADTYDGNNGIASCWWQGKIRVGHTRGIVSFAPTDALGNNDIPEYSHPSAYGFPNETPIFGRCVAMCDSSDGFLYVAFFDETTTWLCVMTPKELVGASVPGGYVFHGAEAVFVGELITHLRVISQSGVPKLLIGTEESDGTAHLYTQDLPRAGSPFQDWDNGGSMQFAPESEITYPAEPFSSAAARKLVWAMAATTENLGTGRTLDLQLSADGGTFESQGTISTSPFLEIVTSGTQTSGRWITPKVVMTSQEAEPSVLRSLSMQAAVQMRRREIKEYDIYLGPNQPLKGGGHDDRDIDALWTQIKELPNQGYLSMVNQFGQTQEVRVHSVIPHKIIEGGPDKEWEVHATLRISIQSTTINYDSGFNYDSGYQYGGS